MSDSSLPDFFPSESLLGQFLVASKNMRDPNFFQTVVLIIRHGEEGALGLIVNRPSGNKDAPKIQKRLKLPRPEQPMYEGGPVEPSALFILHNGGEDEAVWPVLDGLVVGTSPQAFFAVSQAAEQGRDVAYRVFAGCAGWAPSQLDGELFRNDWHLQPATAELVLQADPYTMWQELATKALANHRLLPHFSGNPELN